MTASDTNNLTILMRPMIHSEVAGWQARLKGINPGYRVLSRSERFGRLSHVIKLDGHRIELLQGAQTACKSILSGSEHQTHQMIGDLLKAGAISSLPAAY